MLSSILSCPHTMLKLNEFERNIQQSKTMLLFRNSLLKIDRPIPKLIYNIHNPRGLKLLTLRLGMSHLNQDKFNHYFRDCVNPLCPCSLEIESCSYFFLRCYYFTDIQRTLFSELLSVEKNILNQSDNKIVELLLYSNQKFKF